MTDFVIHPEPARVFSVPPNRAIPQSGSATPPAPIETPESPKLAHEDIARRAYDIYVKKGRQPGQCRQNWRQAERELHKQTVPAGPLRFSDAAPVARPVSAPVVRTFAAAVPAIAGGPGSPRRGTTPVLPGGRDTRP
jgi:hypothetical protein